MKRSDLFFTALLIPLDYAAVVASFLLAYFIRDAYPVLIPPFLLGEFADTLNYAPELPLLPFFNYQNYIFGITGVMVLVFALSGLYRVQRFSTLSRTSRRVGRSIGLAFLVLIIMTFIRGNAFLPRLVILYALVITIVALLIVRLLVHILRNILQNYGIGIVRIAVLGEGKNAGMVASSIRSSRNGYRLVDRFSKDELKKVYRAINKRVIDELIIADSHLSQEASIELREACIENLVGFSFVPNMLEMVTSNIIVREVKGFPIIEVLVTPLEGWGRIVKRIFDLILASVSLIVLLPLCALISILLYIDNPGPILFRHKRLGQNLDEFNLFKFRTMKSEYCDGAGNDIEAARKRFQKLLDNNLELKEEWETYHKLKKDPRVTRLGNWLRKISFDELPQIFNVIRGELSLVGPRPIVKEELEKYGRLQYRLSAIKPGITGLWQVSGRNDTTYEERVRLDMIYVETWSLWLDIVILFKTISALVMKRGAY